MDEMYIKMAKEAVEIQDQWEINLHDKLVLIESTGNHEVSRVGISTRRYLRLKKNPRVFWLPIQEDLQKIAIKYLRKEDKKNGGDPEGWDNILLQDAFWHWFREFEDMNFSELWLSFVMETCYHKQWNMETQTWETTQ